MHEPRASRIGLSSAGFGGFIARPTTGLRPSRGWNSLSHRQLPPLSVDRPVRWLHRSAADIGCVGWAWLTIAQAQQSTR